MLESGLKGLGPQNAGIELGLAARGPRSRLTVMALLEKTGSAMTASALIP